MEKLFKMTCPACEEKCISMIFSDLTEKHKKCDSCGEECKIQFFDELDDMEDIVEFAGISLEDNNHHSISNLPYEMWLAVKPEIEDLPKEKQFNIVKAMMKEFREV